MDFRNQDDKVETGFKYLSLQQRSIVEKAKKVLVPGMTGNFMIS